MARRLREASGSCDFQEPPISSNSFGYRQNPPKSPRNRTTLPKPTDARVRSNSLNRGKSPRQELLDIERCCASMPVTGFQRPVTGGPSDSPRPHWSRGRSKEASQLELPEISTSRPRSNTDGPRSTSRAVDSDMEERSCRSRFETWPRAEDGPSLSKENLELLSTRDFANHLRRCTSPSQNCSGSASASGASILNLGTSDSEEEDLAAAGVKIQKLPTLARGSSSEDDGLTVQERRAKPQEKYQRWRWRVLRRASRASQSGEPEGHGHVIEPTLPHDRRASFNMSF